MEAIHNKKIVMFLNNSPISGLKIKKPIATIWTVVLLLAIYVTLIGFSPVLSTKNCRIDEIISSLEIIISEGTINKTELDKKTHQIKTKHTSNLSASKSSKAPKEVVVLVFLAINPSR